MVCLVYNYLRSVRYFLFGVVVVVSVWWLDIQLTVQSVHITTKVVSSNTAHGALHSMQQYVIRLSVICDRSMVFFLGTPVFLHQ